MKTKIYMAIMIAISCLSKPINAQIFYQDLNPDIVINTWNMYNIHIDSLTTSTLSYGGAGNITIWQEFNKRIAVNAFSDCEVMMSGAYPSALDANSSISSAATWVKPDYEILYNGTNGHWQGVTDKYLGVRVKNGTHWLYGWIRMGVNNTGNSVTIKDYACNRTPDAAINAGQSTSGIEHPTIINNQYVSIYPNPFSDYATILLQENLNTVSVNIYNSFGKLVNANMIISDNKITINRHNLCSGIYYYELKQNNDFIASGKLIICD